MLHTAYSLAYLQCDVMQHCIILNQFIGDDMDIILTPTFSKHMLHNVLVLIKVLSKQSEILNPTKYLFWPHNARCEIIISNFNTTLSFLIFVLMTHTLRKSTMTTQTMRITQFVLMTPHFLQHKPFYVIVLLFYIKSCFHQA